MKIAFGVIYLNHKFRQGNKGFKLANINVSLLTTYLVPDLTGTSQ